MRILFFVLQQCCLNLALASNHIVRRRTQRYEAETDDLQPTFSLTPMTYSFHDYYTNPCNNNDNDDDNNDDIDDTAATIKSPNSLSSMMQQRNLISVVVWLLVCISIVVILFVCLLFGKNRQRRIQQQQRQDESDDHIVTTITKTQPPRSFVCTTNSAHLIITHDIVNGNKYDDIEKGCPDVVSLPNRNSNSISDDIYNEATDVSDADATTTTDDDTSLMSLDPIEHRIKE